MEKPKVAIASITYNQVKYIKQALDGFVMQKTDFPFVVYIGDDCSTDGTTEIVREYAEKYPDIIKPIYHEKNTCGADNFKDTFEACDSEYVAWCEGDDYWTDPYKLQKQADFLDKNPDFSICFHPVKVMYENHERKDEIYPDNKIMSNRTEISFDELLFRNYIQTNSVMYRWRFSNGDVMKYMPKDILPGDWYLHLLHAQVGRVGFMRDVMSVYRRQPGGIWYDSIDNFDKLYLKHGFKVINFYLNVYNNIANKSERYLNKLVLPTLKDVLFAYFLHGDFEALSKIKNNYPELIEKIVPMDGFKFYVKKINKYKKLYNLFLMLFILSCLGIIVCLTIFNQII